MINRLAELVGHDVPRETLDRLNAYVPLLLEAAEQQNLIAKSTIDNLWERHIFDSAQLLRLASPGGAWLDIGSGAGLPGIVLAILNPAPITLVEPRRLRIEFLASVVDALSLSNVTLVHGKPAAITETFAMITTRAVASAPDLFAMALHLSLPQTVWLLPKGRSAQKELDEARKSWQGDFRLEPSMTDAGASILMASGVRRRGR
ncbi:MAG: 16S rRNA (guanine(527)-N(7))-methyltransferase RsmG [Sphingomicrobium sp.]